VIPQITASERGGGGLLVYLSILSTTTPSLVTHNSQFSRNCCSRASHFEESLAAHPGMTSTRGRLPLPRCRPAHIRRVVSHLPRHQTLRPRRALLRTRHLERALPSARPASLFHADHTTTLNVRHRSPALHSSS
jgi:hypothetical protein